VQPGTCPGEFQTQYRKTEGNYYDRRPGGYDHHYASEEYGRAYDRDNDPACQFVGYSNYPIYHDQLQLANEL
jgi:hypothetical protein